MPIRIIHITDTHLLKDPDDVFAGLKTQKTFEDVLSKIKERFYPADLLLATGDIVHNDASPETYKRFASHIEKLNIKTLTSPGNHDNAKILKQTLEDGIVSFTPHHIIDNWQFIILDSSVENAVNGHLPPEQLELAEHYLQENPKLNALIAMHHHPVSVNCRWLDMSGIDNGEELIKLADKYKNIKIFLWGHVHQDFVSQKNGVKLYATPSTCIQFKPMQFDFSLDDEPPGFRWLELHENGQVDTGVIRLDELPTEIDFNTRGYK